MANIYKGALDLIGNTPLVEVTNIKKDVYKRQIKCSPLAILSRN